VLLFYVSVNKTTTTAIPLDSTNRVGDLYHHHHHHHHLQQQNTAAATDKKFWPGIVTRSSTV
jgi:hypothetical protein